MPRPEAVIHGLQELMENIRTGRSDNWKDYYQRYDHYLANQQRLFGETWQTPTDVIGEAKNYGVLGPETEGEHTRLLGLHKQPLEPLRMTLNAGKLERLE
jgi:NADH-quinone oxidoreductase subunit B